MKAIFRTTALAVSLVGATFALSACASQQDVEKAQSTADQALSAAQHAQSTADEALSTAKAADQKADEALSKANQMHEGPRG